MLQHEHHTVLTAKLNQFIRPSTRLHKWWNASEMSYRNGRRKRAIWMMNSKNDNASNHIRGPFLRAAYTGWVKCEIKGWREHNQEAANTSKSIFVSSVTPGCTTVIQEHIQNDPGVWAAPINRISWLINRTNEEPINYLVFLLVAINKGRTSIKCIRDIVNNEAPF